MQEGDVCIPERLTADEKLVLDEYRDAKRHGFCDLQVVIDHGLLKAVRYTEKNEGESLKTVLAQIEATGEHNR